YEIASRVDIAHERESTTTDGWLLPAATLLTLPGLVADRMHVLLLGSGGEAPISPPIAALGVNALLVAAVPVHRGQAGALVLSAADAAHWDRDDQELLERVARTFGARLQSDALF